MSDARDREAYLLLPALWKAHEYLRNEAAPHDNRVTVALSILDDALAAWALANPLPDDEDQDDGLGIWKDCCKTPLHERGHLAACTALAHVGCVLCAAGRTPADHALGDS